MFFGSRKDIPGPQKPHILPHRIHPYIREAGVSVVGGEGAGCYTDLAGGEGAVLDFADVGAVDEELEVGAIGDDEQGVFAADALNRAAGGFLDQENGFVLGEIAQVKL